MPNFYKFWAIFEVAGLWSCTLVQFENQDLGLKNKSGTEDSFSEGFLPESPAKKACQLSAVIMLHISYLTAAFAEEKHSAVYHFQKSWLLCCQWREGLQSRRICYVHVWPMKYILLWIFKYCQPTVIVTYTPPTSSFFPSFPLKNNFTVVFFQKFELQNYFFI